MKMMKRISNGIFAVLLLAAGLLWIGCPMDSSRRNNDPVEPPEYRPTEPPAAPDKLTVSAVDGKAAVSWSNYTAGNKFITAFEVEYAAAAGSPSTVTLEPQDKKIYSYALIGGLDAAQSYSFRVRAQNALGWGEWSDPIPATPAAATSAPERPDVFFDMTRMGQNDLHPQWLAKNAVQYQVKYGTTDNIDAASPWPADGSAIGERWAYIPSLTAGRYFVWVRAGNSAGWSDWEQASRRTKDPSRPDITKNNVNGVPVHSTFYIEILWNDPRVAMGYTLVRDGMPNTPFYDTVILFAANLRNRDCNAEIAAGTNTGTNLHHCTKTGVHLHINDNLQYLLDHRDPIIRDLQDKGIRVELGLLPNGDGFTYGTMGQWPFEDVSPVAGPGHPGMEQNNGTAKGANPPAAWANGYPYDYAARTKFIQDIRDVVVQYGLDGVDLDDEYASSGKGEYQVVYPAGADVTEWNYYYYGGSTQGNKRIEEIGGRQTAEFRVELKETLNAVEAGRYTVTAYEFRYLRNMPETLEWKGKTVRLRDYVDYFNEAVYGSYIAESFTPGTPNSRYAPFACDLGGGKTARPQYGAGYGAVSWCADYHIKGNYGGLIFYGAMSRGGHQGKPTYFGTAGRMPEHYLTLIAERIFGGRVIYEGDDYEKTWGTKG
jgi:hypothetical protein